MPQVDGWSQAKQREFMDYFDQHDRHWTGWGDVKAKLHPTGTMKPEFDAPWYPDQRYARFGAKNPNRFEWDYEAMLADAKLGETRYRELLFQAADHFNVPNFDPDAGEATAQMKRDIGRPPFPSDPIRAAIAGNGYILGMREFDPSKPGDVKLRAALDQFTVNLGTPDLEALAEFADEYADEPEESKPAKRRPGRPTNAERAARAAQQEG